VRWLKRGTNIAPCNGKTLCRHGAPPDSCAAANRLNMYRLSLASHISDQCNLQEYHVPQDMPTPKCVGDAKLPSGHCHYDVRAAICSASAFS